MCPQKYGTLESEWDSQKGLQPLTRKFQIFANKVSTNMTMIFYVNISTKKCLLCDCNERNFDKEILSAMDLDGGGPVT